MTIDKLILRNFQGHKHSTLEFPSGLSAITGESDEGKTSIIRALYWAAQNKPSGGDFISDFSKRGECSSAVVVDGNEVTRFKNKSKNEYRVNGLAFKALGKGGVPDEVKNILQLDDLNFQNQMDAPFLLSNNGGEVARYLNKVADLDIISTSLTKIKSKVDSANRDIKSKEAEIEINKTELEELNWIKEAEKELSQLEDDYLEFENKQSLQELLIDTLEECDDLGEELEKYQDNETEEMKIRLLLEQYRNYKTGLGIFETFTSELNNVKTIINKIDSLPFNKKEIESIIDLSALIDTYQTEYKTLNQFDNLIGDIYGLKDEKEVCVESIQTSETEFKNEFPSVCPLCDQEIN